MTLREILTSKLEEKAVFHLLETLPHSDQVLFDYQLVISNRLAHVTAIQGAEVLPEIEGRGGMLVLYTDR